MPELANRGRQPGLLGGRGNLGAEKGEKTRTIGGDPLFAQQTFFRRGGFACWERAGRQDEHKQENRTGNAAHDERLRDGIGQNHSSIRAAGQTRQQLLLKDFFQR
jgi:hypothetical protein